MPIRQRVNPPLASHAQEKTNRLVQEWQNPQEAHGNPIIIEEGGLHRRAAVAWANRAAGGSGPTRIYVIWDEWRGLDQLERSAIIMEAFQIARGEPAALEVTLAMGLTPQEADRLGIEYA